MRDDDAGGRCPCCGGALKDLGGLRPECPAALLFDADAARVVVGDA